MRRQKLISATIVIAAVVLMLGGPFVRMAAAQDAQPGGAATIAATASATVKAIDAQKRVVTLETPDGAMVNLRCGKDVVNFDQIKVGDQVKATAVERLVLYVGKAGSPSEGAGTIVALAPKGGKPGIFICDTEEMTDKIDSVDAANHTVTLQGVEGQARAFKVSPNVDLSAIKQGDDVTVRCTKGLALLVQHPQDAAQPAAARIEPGGMALEALTATATVQSVDQAKRLVTLKTPDGATKTVHLGPECINFNQIQVGDQVRATLAEEVAVAVSKGGAPPSAGEETVIARAPQGAKPGVIIADSDQITGKIQSVDAANRTITLAEVDGKPKTVKVGSKVDLTQLSNGDDVVVRCTQALAIVVEKP